MALSLDANAVLEEEPYLSQDSIPAWKKYALAHPERIKATQKAYGERNKEKRRAYGRVYRAKRRAEDPEGVRLYKRAHRHPETERAWRKANPEKTRAASKKSKEKNSKMVKHRMQKSALRRRYGLSWIEFLAMRERQQNRCAVCKKPFERTPHVDHHHAELIIRELLCARCNVLVGALEDDRVQAAANYIRNHGGEVKLI